jgi:hypothetical protein
MRNVQISPLLLKRVNLTVDPAIEAINLAAAYCFCFLNIQPAARSGVSPPRSQTLVDLDNVLLQLISLRDNELLCTTEGSLALR